MAMTVSKAIVAMIPSSEDGATIYLTEATTATLCEAAMTEIP
jgi:hypothetical protein